MAGQITLRPGVPALPPALDEMTVFFQVFNYGLLRGRTFSDEDLAGRRTFVVVNEAFAHKFFSKNDPIGQRADFPQSDEEQQVQQRAASQATAAPTTKAPDKIYFEIAGVVPRHLHTLRDASRFK